MTEDFENLLVEELAGTNVACVIFCACRGLAKVLPFDEPIRRSAVNAQT